MKNLDLLAAEAAQKIISDTKNQKPEDLENLVTKALGVLQENGVYASMLYLYSRTSPSDKTVAKEVRGKLLELTTSLGLKIEKPPKVTADSNEVLKFLSDNICNNLDTLLLVRQVWEQTLIYARYGAKARKNDKEKGEL
jgi:hypothetical protein